MSNSDHSPLAAEKKTAVSTRKPMIEAVGLSKFYGPFGRSSGRIVLVGEGELVAFLGPNGAGKSTTMKMLTAISHPAKALPALLATT